MSEEFEINAEKREVVGKGSSRRLRRLEDKVPGIIYGGKKKNPQNITLMHKDLLKATENEAFFSHILTLNLEGTQEQVVVKDMQRHPAKPKILHVDFQRVSKDVAIHIHVPLHFVNEDTCVGVKKQGGAISHSMTEVEISCLPGDLPEYIEVDMLKVEIDQIVHLSDLVLPKGVELIALTHGEDHDLPVVSVHTPKKAAEETEEVDAAEVPTVDSKDNGEESDED
ncbi:MAG: 50S ribosomal protein L25/general stress protein Ctc [Pseudomonadales bacterium]|nr:50S ribosomal protein L25/general stress protein Ctc [Pseudomonadales bacterium]